MRCLQGYWDIGTEADSVSEKQPAEALRRRAKRLPHAVVRSVAVYPDGHIGEESELHYLTCVRCELERQADAIDPPTERTTSSGVTN